MLPWRTTDEPLFYGRFLRSRILGSILLVYDGFSMSEELRDTPEESYHKKLGKMIKEIKEETKWRDIFKIVEEAQKRLNGKE